MQLKGESGPAPAIPAEDLWIHKNPEALKSIREGLRDASEGRVTKVKDIEKFFEEL